jgi:hypothetical protein
VPRAVAIATITLARSESEAGKLQRSLQVLSAGNLPVFVSDGGSPAAFVKAIGALPSVEVRTGTGGLVCQVKDSVGRAAASADLVIYTEPDKEEFFTSGLAALIERAVECEEASVVIACRDTDSMATFPAGQQKVERAFNDVAAEFLGIPSDFLYGPLALRKKVAQEILPGSANDLGWGWRPNLIARVLRSGGRVVAHEGYLPCPSDQRDEDDARARLYRLAQLEQNVRGLYAGVGLTGSSRFG